MDRYQLNIPSSIRPSERFIDQYIKPEIPYLSKRYTVALLSCLGFIISFGFQINMPTVSYYENDKQIFLANATTFPNLHCNNDNQTNFRLLGTYQSIYWIYLARTSFITGGVLAFMYPAQKVFGIAIALQTVFNFIYVIPFKNCIIIEVVRIVQEFFHIVAYVACVGVWKHWAPQQDRSCLLAISYCGPYVGLFICGYLSKVHETINNNAPLFLIYGIIGIFWFLIWTWLVFEKPLDHPSISKTELMYINSSIINANSTTPSLTNIPWKKMFTSKPVYALLIIYTCQVHNYSPLSIAYKIRYKKLLIYKFKNILKNLNLNQISSAVIMLFVGFLADIITKNSCLSTTNIRKLFITILVTADCLFGYYTVFLGDYVNNFSICFNFTLNLMVKINFLDVAPKYATLLMSISGVIVLIKVFLLNEIMSLNYYEYFIIELWMITVYFTSIMFYLKFGSSVEEHWSEDSNDNDHLPYENTPVILQDLLAKTIAVEIKQSNEQAHVENTSSRTPTLYRIINKHIKILYFRKRYIVAILTWIGFIISFGAQTNTPLFENEISDDFFIYERNQLHLNQNHSAYLKLYECQKDILNDTNNMDFDLSDVKNVYWSLFGQIIGGIIVYMYPAQRVFGISIALQTAFNFFLMIPFENCIILKAIRIIQETLQFVAYISCIGIWRHWAPLQERPYLLAISYCGPHVGLFIGGYLVQNVCTMSNSNAHLLIYGITGLMWYSIWTWLIFEKPCVHPSINNEELNYIDSSLGIDQNTNAPSLADIPWKHIFSSKPVYALLIVNSCKVFNNYHSLSVFKNNFSRKFKNDMTNKGINSNLILSSIIMLFGGFMANIIQKNFSISTINTRKLFISVNILLESIFTLYYFQRKIFRGFMMLSFDGIFNLMFIISCLDVTPKYATILLSFSSAINIIRECLLSLEYYFNGFPNNQNDGHFFLVWLTFLQFIGVMFYLKLASSDKQHWSEESIVPDSLTIVSESVVLQENSNNTNAKNMMNSDNAEPRIQNESVQILPDQPPSRLIDNYIKSEIPFLNKRYTLAVLTFFGFVFVYALQCTMHNVSLEQINYIHKRSFDMFNNEPNASLENANNDYNALLEVFNYVHNSSFEKKINIMYNKTEQVNYIFNQSLKEKLNKEYNWTFEVIYFQYNEKNKKIIQECNEKIEKINHKYNVVLEEFNYTYNKQVEEKFDCIYNKSLETFKKVYNDQIREIFYEYNTGFNETKNYMFEKILKKDCDQNFNELVEEIKMYRVHVLHTNANKIAELVKLSCKKSYWEKDFLAFVFGNALVQIPGGILAYLYPAHKIFGAAIGLSSLINLFTTIIYDEVSSKYVILFLQGLIQGMMYPACHGIWRHWAPPFERSRLSTISFSGIFVGIVIGIPLTNTLNGSLGWKIPYYTYGIAGILWYIVWTWLSFEKPSHHPVISKQERNHIQYSLTSTSDLTAASLFKYIPWKQMITSKPVWAIIVADFCHMWNSVFNLLILAVEINLPLSTEQFYVIIPFFFASIVILLGGVIADYLIMKSILYTTNVRKVFTCGGFTMEAFIILLSAFSSWREEAQSYICLLSSITFSGLAFSGFNVNHLDIAPRYASILLGITNSISLIAVIVLFPFVTYILEMPKSLQQGIDVFPYLTSVTICLQFVGDVFYSSCASGEQQPWAEPAFNENMSTDRTKANLEKKLPPRSFRLLL